MDDNKNKKWTLDDGRRAERRVMEQKKDDGVVERVVELHVEDERPLKLQQRVIEKSKPIIYEREIETLDTNTGEILDRKIESIEPKVQMQIVEHITSSVNSNVVSAQSIQSAQSDCDCYVTKEEMIDTIVSAIKASKESSNQVQTLSAPSDDLTKKLHSLGLADEIGVKKENGNVIEYVFLISIVAVVTVLGYILFIA